jgi:hypothetical protein
MKATMFHLTDFQLLVEVSPNYKYRIWKVYNLEHADIPNFFYTPHHIGHCCIYVIGVIIFQQQPLFPLFHSSTLR